MGGRFTSWSFGLGSQALQDEVFELFIEDKINGLGESAGDDFFEDLGWGLAFPVGDLHGDYFEEAHSEGVDIDFGSVPFLVDFWGHEFGGSDDAGGVGFSERGCESEVTDSDFVRHSIDEYIFAFDVSVYDGEWLLAVEIFEAFENFSAPVFDDFESGFFYFSEMSSEV